MIQNAREVCYSVIFFYSPPSIIFFRALVNLSLNHHSISLSPDLAHIPCQILSSERPRLETCQVFHWFGLAQIIDETLFHSSTTLICSEIQSFSYLPRISFPVLSSKLCLIQTQRSRFPNPCHP